jgi:hypothetical protein
VPLNRSVDELAVHAVVRAETDIGSPLLKIEEIAEKLKCLVFAEQLETNRIAHVRFEDRRGLLKIEYAHLSSAHLDTAVDKLDGEVRSRPRSQGSRRVA